jgi:hypothetical protein
MYNPSYFFENRNYLIWQNETVSKYMKSYNNTINTRGEPP